ncbi:hypothetical protein B5C34_14265 [Pacificimonas flava]|uniref:histidine kinase n=2 Tax=Pacificimonas TaxID=1960290 RepID=A0A219B822_9SPHN|nr:MULTISPECIES: ATP-binding protein [Pacificimonas]MBZ6379989.1 HAMP domain-containing protein [Pacificimonas aurantium]OWV34507.1 hypothetical protein B5C34_14265 [Pacificimonas flava]
MRFRRLGLTAQLLIVVALALFLAQAVNFALIFNERRQVETTRSVEPAVARLLIAAERPDFFDGGRGRPGFRERFLDRIERRGPPNIPETRRYVRLEQAVYLRLEQAGTPAEEVRIFAMDRRAERKGDPGRLVVFANFPEIGWRVVSTRPPVPPFPLFGYLFFQTLVIFAVTLVPLLFFARRASRSLATLGAAAQRYRGTGEPEPVQPAGPADVRALIVAFNDMRARLSRMIAEKDQMLGAIGHDLRTPLASLRIRAESVEDAEERAAMIEAIEELNTNLEDILVLARMGRAKAPSEPTDLAALAAKVVRTATSGGLEARLSAPEAVIAPVHVAAVRRALQNLVDNAARYGGRASVGLTATETTACFVVEDEGPGIPEADLVRAAEPFVRLEHSRNRETGGSGLGLAIAKAVADLHGGSLKLENCPAGGLRAELCLPRR